MPEILSKCKIKILQKIREVSIGQKELNQIKIGGQNAMPLIESDGDIPNKTKIAAEIPSLIHEKYPTQILEAWANATKDPLDWAKKAQDLGASMIGIRIHESENNHQGISRIIELNENIITKLSLPTAILGTNNKNTDSDMLPKIAKELKGTNSLIGAIEEEIYKQIIPTCIESDLIAIARTPIDINLAKQLNILISDLGFNLDKIVIDPNMGGLGYGLDYGYSVIEKIRLAAFEGDPKLNMPIIAFTGEEAWKAKEAKAKINDKYWGNNITRGIIWESITTSSIIMSGADLVVMRHPESIKHISQMLGAN